MGLQLSLLLLNALIIMFIRATALRWIFRLTLGVALIVCINQIIMYSWAISRVSSEVLRNEIHGVITAYESAFVVAAVLAIIDCASTVFFTLRNRARRRKKRGQGANN